MRDDLFSNSTEPNSQKLGLAASEALYRSLQAKKKNIYLSGTQSVFSLALLLSDQIKLKQSKPHLVVLSKTSQALAFKEQFQSLCPQQPCHYLPPFDVSPYSNLEPSPSVIAQRMHWLFAASHRPEVFLATPLSLSQLTLPFVAFQKNCFSIELNSLGLDSPKTLLESLGYHECVRVEDIGHFACRGGIFDIFSPAHKNPIRLELFGDHVEDLRLFDPLTQRSLAKISRCHIIPAKEVFYANQDRFKIIQRLKKELDTKPALKDERDEAIKALSQQKFIHGLDYYLPYFYDQLEGPLNYFNEALTVWSLPEDGKELDSHLEQMRKQNDEYNGLSPSYKKLFVHKEELTFPEDSTFIQAATIHPHHQDKEISLRSLSLDTFANGIRSFQGDRKQEQAFIKERLSQWKESSQKIFIFCSSQPRLKRVQAILEELGFEVPILESENSSLQFQWTDWIAAQEHNPRLIHTIHSEILESLQLPQEKFVFLRDRDLIPTQETPKRQSAHQLFNKKARALSFGELNTGDLIVHKTHGIGIYHGLKVMSINGCETELLQLEYKNKDRLYIPTYRIGQIQKYMGPSHKSLVDKLGGNQWGKIKSRVKKKLRDIASELVKLYAKRLKATRPPATKLSLDFDSFSEEFPFPETIDQTSAIQDVVDDMSGEKPMDRLICGDVGFGKTEVAMRATFKAIEKKGQIALIAPTTVLTFQHFRNFQKRFQNWPVHIVCLNRFIPKKQLQKNISDIASGKANLIIGTHKLLSKSISFKDLGLLIIDEEQKFGVKHKEKIRQLKDNVDTLALSATPIPRTLNMSLVGIRDLSLMSTPPIDRLPTRTLISLYTKSIVSEGIEHEIKRGGQVFFLHNKVQSIDSVAHEVKSFYPHARVAVAHGQMKENSLEQVMLDFFNHKIDVLVCTTIIESGIDIPNANTMFINNAHHLGLSQLYQLRGRIGRSKNRAYCYLLVPNHKEIDSAGQERLKVIQENTSLGSGIQIAQHDLELRGAGNLLGEDQSGHIHAIGYEMYNELLEEAIKEEKGAPPDKKDVEPELNLRIPALIPEKYINSVKIRLSYYKILSEITDASELDSIEEELTDQFGKPPEEVLNLMGLMLIRKECKQLSVTDLNSGKDVISLNFTEHTHLSTETILNLTRRENKKYSITPDSRLIIRIKSITWPRVYEELAYLNSIK